MKTLLRVAILIMITTFASIACGSTQSDHAAPVITDIATSGKVVVISDCVSTSVTITAKVTDASTIKSVLLWYRVDSQQPFTSTTMNAQGDLYTASVKGSDLQGNGYGAMEFYISAQDEAGNSSKSPVDNSIQFLPCVSN